jgi:hypothetical protein
MLAAMALLLAAVTAWSSQAIAPVATPVYSAAILVRSAAWSGGDGESSASGAAVRALVELYSQQSQSVALIEAADLIAATLSSAVLSHTKVLHVLDGPGLTVAATVLPNATLPLSFEIMAAHQPDESFHCSDDLDCELNGICQQVRGRLVRTS